MPGQQQPGLTHSSPPAQQTSPQTSSSNRQQTCPPSLAGHTETCGITGGGNAHRIDEYIEVSAVAPGIRQLIMLTLATADATP